MSSIIINGTEEVILGKLSIEDLIKVVRNNAKVILSDESAERIKKCRKFVEKVIQRNDIVYGVTTGVGDLASVTISRDKIKKLQKNIIRSHSAGCGEELPSEVIRGAMLIRANVMASGYTGVRLETVKKYIKLINENVVPIVCSAGSVGASGDLVPMAHIALSLMGEGDVYYRNKKMKSSECLKKLGMEHITLDAKEALGLINGTHFSTSVGAIAHHDLINITKNCEIGIALSYEALGAKTDPLREEIHLLRPFHGQIICAADLRKLLMGSEKVNKSNKVQDAYTLRCAPQIVGSMWEALEYAKKIIETEMNAVSDNPLFDYENETVLSGGNFHGQILAGVLDYLSVVSASIGGYMERLVNRLLNPHLSSLPAFLTKDYGLNTGYMMLQYTAASLVNENKVLSHPASSDSIPLSADQEDYVPMAMYSAMKLRRISENLKNIASILMLCSSQAVDFVVGEDGKGTKIALETIRKKIERLGEDIVLSKEISKMNDLVSSGEIVKCVEIHIGKLGRDGE